MSLTTDRMVFLACPKTGTQWVRNTLAALEIPFNQTDLHAIQSYDDGRYHWTVRRDPEDWLRSYFLSISTRIGVPIVDRLRDLDCSSFGAFLREYRQTCPDYVETIFAAYAAPCAFVGELDQIAEVLCRALYLAGHRFDREIVMAEPRANVHSWDMSRA